MVAFGHRYDYDQTWEFDGLGNFSTFNDDGDTQTRTANAANEISGITGGSVTPSYDNAGNMISGPKPGDDTTRIHYVYDAWNRLMAVYEDDGDGLFEPETDDSRVVEYRYDGLNRRVSKIRDWVGIIITFRTEYYYNQQWQVVEERDRSWGTTVASNQYVWSPRYVDSPIVRFHDGNGDGDLLDVGDNTRYYTSDANHNVTAMIDASSGDVVERYVYNAYGKATVYDEDWANPAAPSADGPLYCGYFFDAESGLYQVRNRYYDSSLSTFISRDPIGYKGGINLYEYVGENPLTRTDPSGLTIEPAGPICEAVKSSDSGVAGAAGFIACKNGKQYICINHDQISLAYPNDAAVGIIGQCVVQHELQHLSQPGLSCPKCGIGTPHYDPKDKPKIECPGFEAELGCLKGASGYCKGDQACLDQVNRRTRYVEWEMRKLSCHTKK